MNHIIEKTIEAWQKTRKIKRSPSNWISRNCPACEHRGHSPDTRGRGGLILSGDNVNIHCFNCNLKTGYTIGKPISKNFELLLGWLGFDEREISQFKFEALKFHRLEENSYVFPKRNIKEIENFPNSFLLSDVQGKYLDHVEFLKTRGFKPEDYPFLVSNDLVYRKRIIFPFILNDIMVGYSARSIHPSEKNKYIMRMTTDFVFGLEWVKNNHKIVFVTEGLFDALSIQGLAVMHNEISDNQIKIINDLKKDIIVIPHLDKSGLRTSKNQKSNYLIDVALKQNWGVAFPDWNAKDVNEAYVQYGSLFCVQHLLKSTIRDKVKIQLLQQKLYYNVNKRRY